jgi:hypothetical protein
MTDIYIDPGVAGMPDAFDQLRHLTETGHNVFILGNLPASMEEVPFLARAEELPEVPPPGSWLVTSDPELCGARRPPLTSMLLGPRPAPSPRPAPRCDAEARDLAAAVLHILGHEAYD